MNRSNYPRIRHRSIYNGSNLSIKSPNSKLSKSQFLSSRISNKKKNPLPLPWIKKQCMSNLSFNPKTSEFSVKQEDFGLYSKIMNGSQTSRDLNPIESEREYSLFTEVNLESFKQRYKSVCNLDKKNVEKETPVPDFFDIDFEENKPEKCVTRKILVGVKYLLDFVKDEKIFLKVYTKDFIFPAKLVFGNKESVCITFVSFLHNNPSSKNYDFFSRRKVVGIKLREVNNHNPKKRVIEYWDKKENPEYLYFTLIPQSNFESTIKIVFLGKKKKRKNASSVIKKNREKITKEKFKKINYGKFFNFCRFELKGLKSLTKLSKFFTNNF